jgi:excisionase family DNA binding protein
MEDNHHDNLGPTTTPISYSVEAAAAVSGSSRTTLYEVIRNGGLRAVKKGKRRLIFRDDLIAWLNDGDAA